MYDRAEAEAANQRGQLARHFYLRAIEKNSSKDRLRFDSLSGLANLCFDQLYDYKEGMSAAEMAIREFGESPFFRDSTDTLRLKAAFVARTHLQDPQRAWEFVSPMVAAGRIKHEAWREIGRIHLELRQYKEAERAFQNLWESSLAASDCKALREAQLDMMQTHSLSRDCMKVIEWGNLSMPKNCKSDLFSVRAEMAHCYELRGESDKAIVLIQDLLAQNPENYRAEYLLKNIKKRQRDKLSK